jgi:hypothetical protein
MGFWDSLKGFASNLWSGIKNTATNIWNKVSPVIRAVPFIGDKIATGVEAVGGAINSGANALGSLAQGNISGAMEGVKEAYNKGKEGINKLTTLKKGGVVNKKMFQRTK